jgi:hypothetical protein
MVLSLVASVAEGIAAYSFIFYPEDGGRFV